MAPPPKRTEGFEVLVRPGDAAVCRFCGAAFVAGERGEDVSSNWYAKAIGFPDVAVTLAVIEHTGDSAEVSRQSQTPAAKEFRLHDVCPGCNGSWMSGIEQGAKDLVLPMSRGDEVELSPARRRTLASWGQLKAICWDALQFTDTALTPADSAAFRSGHPLHWSVSLARVESNGPEEITFTRHVAIATNLPGLPITFRATIIFNELMISVGRFLDSGLPVEMLRDMTTPALMGIWPPTIGKEDSVVIWPCSSVIAKRDLGGLL